VQRGSGLSLSESEMQQLVNICGHFHGI
jgi:hypothetical protein